MDYWAFAGGWVLDDGTSPYTVLGSTGRPHEKHSRIVRTPGQTLQAAVDAAFGAGTALERATLARGEHFFRIHRPHGPQTSPYRTEWLNAVQSIRLLLGRLESVFAMIEPAVANNACFGHELRHLLILACTEVESAWKGILGANGYNIGARCTTNDYVKLLKPLHLDEWQVSITRCPTYPPMRPFENWDAKQPTASLNWYDAYNYVKHDRESNLSKATFSMTVLSVAAAFALTHAQFGKFGFSGVNVREIDVLQVSAHPTWQPVESYLPPQRGGGWTGKQYSF